MGFVRRSRCCCHTSSSESCSDLSISSAELQCKRARPQTCPTSPASSLEREAHRQLNVASTASAEERIADADVWRCGDRQRSLPNPATRIRRIMRNPIGLEVDQKVRQQRIREVRMVEQVDDVGTELRSDPLTELERLR